MLHDQHQSHHFLRNKEMNEVYFSYAVFQFAMGIIAIFVPIYLYKLGYSIPWVLFYFFLVSVYFLFFSYISAKIVSKIGVKHTMLLAVPLNILYFIGLRYIEIVPLLFFILPVVKAVKLQLYNYGFHLNFIQHSDREKEGRQVAIVQASALIASGLAPFFGGLILKFYNFHVLFVIGSILLFASMIPLFFTKDSYEEVSFNKRRLFSSIFRQKNRGAVLNFAGYAIESWIGFILWPVFLFVLLKNTEVVGFVVSASIFVTIAIFYFVGGVTDKRRKEDLLRVGSVLHFFGWIGRLFAYNLTSVFFIDAYKNFSMRVVQIPWSAYFYEQARKRDYFYFVVQREIAFHFARIAIMPILIIIFVYNFAPYQISFAIAALAALLYAKSYDSMKTKIKSA